MVDHGNGRMDLSTKLTMCHCSGLQRCAACCHACGSINVVSNVFVQRVKSFFSHCATCEWEAFTMVLRVLCQQRSSHVEWCIRQRTADGLIVGRIDHLRWRDDPFSGERSPTLVPLHLLCTKRPCPSCAPSSPPPLLPAACGAHRRSGTHLRL